MNLDADGVGALAGEREEYHACGLSGRGHFTGSQQGLVDGLNDFQILLGLGPSHWGSDWRCSGAGVGLRAGMGRRRSDEDGSGSAVGFSRSALVGQFVQEGVRVEGVDRVGCGIRGEKLEGVVAETERGRRGVGDDQGNDNVFGFKDVTDFQRGRQVFGGAFGFNDLVAIQRVADLRYRRQRHKNVTGSGAPGCGKQKTKEEKSWERRYEENGLS